MTPQNARQRLLKAIHGHNRWARVEVLAGDIAAVLGLKIVITGIEGDVEVIETAPVSISYDV